MRIVEKLLSEKRNQNGFTAFYITILILTVGFAIAISISILTYGEQKISKNIINFN